MNEPEFITTSLAQYREALAQLPAQFAAAQRQSDRKIDLLCEGAGIMGEVQAERDSLTNIQKQIQKQADLLSGRIHMLEEIHKQFYLAPIPDGVTHMYGIELAPLDPETRLKVMHGKDADDWEEVINALGGDPEFPDWDGTWEEEEAEEESDDLPVEQIQPTPPPVDCSVLGDTSLIDAITGAGDPEEDDEPEPEDADLDEIELAEIEARIDDGTATAEDLQRATEMLERIQAAEE